MTCDTMESYTILLKFLLFSVTYQCQFVISSPASNKVSSSVGRSTRQISTAPYISQTPPQYHGPVSVPYRPEGLKYGDLGCCRSKFPGTKVLIHHFFLYESTSQKSKFIQALAKRVVVGSAFRSFYLLTKAI